MDDKVAKAEAQQLGFEPIKLSIDKREKKE